MDPTSSYPPRDPSPMRRRLVAPSSKREIQQDISELINCFQMDMVQAVEDKRLNHSKVNVLNAIKAQGKNLQSTLFIKMLIQLAGVAEKVVMLEFLFEYFTVHFGHECDYKQEEVQSFLQCFRESIKLDDSIKGLEDWLESAGSVIGTYIAHDGLSFSRTQTAFDVFFQLVKPFKFGDALSEIQKKLKLLNYIEKFCKDSGTSSLLRVFDIEETEIAQIKHFEVQQIARYLEKSFLSFFKVLDKVTNLLKLVTFASPDLSKEVLANALLKAFCNSRKKSNFDLFRLFKFFGDLLSEEALSSFIKKNQAEIRFIFRLELSMDDQSFALYWQSKNTGEWRSSITSMGVIFRSLPNLCKEPKIGHAVLSLLLEQCNAKREDLRSSDHEVALIILKDVLLEWTPLQASQPLILNYLHLNITESLEEYKQLSEEQVETFKFQLINFFKISASWLPSATEYAQAYTAYIMIEEPGEAVEKSNQCIAFLLSLFGEPPEAELLISRHIRYQAVLATVHHQKGKVFPGLSERLFDLLNDGFKTELQDRFRLESKEAELLEKVLKPQFFSWMQIFELLTSLMATANLPHLFLDTIIQGLFNQLLRQKSNYFDCQAAVLLYMRASAANQTLIDPSTVFNTLAICGYESLNDGDVKRFLKTFQVSAWLDSVEQVCKFIKNNDGESSAPLRVRFKVLRAINKQLQCALGNLSFLEVRRLVNSLECLKISGFYANYDHPEFTATLLYFYTYFKRNPELNSQEFSNLTNQWLDIFGISLSAFKMIAVNIVKHLDHLVIPPFDFDIEGFLTTLFDLTEIDAFNFAEVEWEFKAEKISSTISLVKATLALFSHRPSAIEWCLSTLLNEANFHAVLDYEDLFDILQLFDRYQSSAMISSTFVMNHVQKLESLAIKSFRFSKAFTYLDITSFPLEEEPFRPLYTLLKGYAARWEINLTKCKIYYFKNWVGASKDSIEKFSALVRTFASSSSLRVSLFKTENSRISQECMTQLLKVASFCHKRIPSLLEKAKKDNFLGSKAELKKLRDVAESANRMFDTSNEHMARVEEKVAKNVQAKLANIDAYLGKMLKGTPSVGHL